MSVATSGFIRLHRKILEWEWYQNPNTFRLFLHCLLKANFTDGQFEGKDVKRGEFVTSLDHLANETRLSTKQVRVSLMHLIQTGELASRSYNRFRIITVVKYDEYQSEGKQKGSQRASEGQAEGKQGASKGQQYKNNNNAIREEGNNNLHFVPPTIEEVREFCQKYDIPVNPDYFFDHYESCGWVLKGGQKMKNWQSTLRNWGRRETDGKYGVRKVPDGENRSEYSFLYGTTVRV